MLSLIIRNSRIYDGRGNPAFIADIGICGERIAVIGDLAGAAADRVVDGFGLSLAPGFIEVHTHYDPQLCWDGKATPAMEHGVTSILTGNCSLSLAPAGPTDRARITALYSRIEDMPRSVFEAGVPYRWESFGEYINHVRPGLAINVGSAVGHSTLRHYVMGGASQERTATASEIAEMRRVLEDAIQGGAFGLSMSHDHVHDECDRPVGSSFADFGERLALAEALAQSGRKYLQCAIHLLDSGKRIAQLNELAEISRRTGLTCSALGIMDNPIVPRQWEAELRHIQELNATGARVVAETQVRPMDLNFCLAEAWLVAFYMPTWAAIMLMPVEDRIARFEDRSLRPQLEGEAERFLPLFGAIRVRSVTSFANERYLGERLDTIAAERRSSLIDALLDISVADLLQTQFGWENVVHADADVVATLLNHPVIRVGGSDAGAHVAQFSGEGDSTYLLEHFVRDGRKMPLESAIKKLTSDLAEDYGLTDRGVLEPGKFADLILFDPKAVRRGPERFVHDLPDGGGRYVRGAEGFRLVAVNGAITLEDNRYTSARAGHVL